MNFKETSFDEKIKRAVTHLKEGGVIAYPTEHCFGLGCDPQNPEAIKQLLKIKQRQPEQGVILIASSVLQVSCYVSMDSAVHKQTILDSWPGPNTWVIPALASVSPLVKGKHEGVAVRVTANTVAKKLCEAYGGAIISTSANRHGEPSLLDAKSVEQVLGQELSYILDEPTGNEASPSTIRDGVTGKRLR